MNDNIKTLANMIDDAKRIVFFGGAGVSTESGIPDFRSKDGLYRSRWEDPPETVLSRSYFNRNTAKFFKFYREKTLHPEAKPNEAHIALAKLEEMGKLTAVITQNIDGLHQLAGSKKVLELHGSTLRNYCMKCKKAYELDYILSQKDIPLCTCGGTIKPDVVLYEEPLNQETIAESLYQIKNADLLIIGGTSLTVYPAAAFVQQCRGKIVIINRDATYMDSSADLVIKDKIGVTLNSAMKLLKQV